MLLIFTISALIILSGTFYKKLENHYITDPLIALIFGVVLGPDLFNLISLENSKSLDILKKATEFTMAVALMATALRIPPNYFRKHFKTQSMIIVLGILAMFLSSSVLLFWLLPLSLPESCLIGAIITPTDPVVASTIVSGENAKKFLAARIRNTISFESGVNDGLVYPLILLILASITTGQNFQNWVLKDLLFATVLCGFLAFGLGKLLGKLMHKAHVKGWMTTKAVLPFSLALAFLLLSGFNAIGMNGIFSVFIGGFAFSSEISENETIQEEHVQESMDRIFTIPVFFIFGLLLPWKEWIDLGIWTSLAIILAIILFRRIPGFLLILRAAPQFKSKFKDQLLIGWFGPIGVAALYYSILTLEKTKDENAWIVTSLVVMASTVIHGLSSLAFSKWYAKSVNKSNAE
ncbi:hypothetical protein APR41_15645 [Salegentibacter salinarum]|uniref:Cation/H+ exchanger transmembrane domain-containing protein n=1 Tax=Salegentibacter salinarum TaxID=447422 RepID=A0A2N0TY37_9FLAO|nr:cation:proton antiporter [Salegentibacter salinarum]PKD19649.1 hypothetical protein APR41_15645 [Salegentibacter salinarum]SKB91078.1 NhaP-type Na+/H+ or K+/H+ antiporter [Salegentibacter salinarum]